MHRGYIKIWRKLLESDMYKSLTSIQRDIMLALLLLANHKSQTWEWKSKMFTCKSGQFITSLDSIKRLCSKKVTYQNIRTALDKFVKWQFLTNESTKTGRLITILNWDTYQSNEIEINKASNNELTKHQQTANKQLTTNKNVKNDKNKRFIKPTIEEITNYCLERKNQIKARVFFDHYESNGWMVGKNKMKDWKAAIRTWEQRNYGDSDGKSRTHFKENWEQQLDAEANQINRELAEARAKQTAPDGRIQDDTG